MKKELDCIVCPMSCHIDIEIVDGEVLQVSGNSCPRGKAFAISEMSCPMRMLTTTVKIQNALHPLLPVISSQNIPKSKIFDIINICKTLEVKAPVKFKDVLVKNIANSGADLIASRSMEMRSLSDQSEDNSSHIRLENI